MKTCLVADDSAVIRKVARRILEMNSFDVTDASEGKDALTACRTRMPDAIILDWSLPDMDSFELIRSVRGMMDGRKTKIIFCLTENDVAQIARARHVGADDHMMKPFDKPQLLQKFEKMGLV
jgi:two-component system, chemotaxis family, chemotaxis protein CheY